MLPAYVLWCKGAGVDWLVGKLHWDLRNIGVHGNAML